MSDDTTIPSDDGPGTAPAPDRPLPAAILNMPDKPRQPAIRYFGDYALLGKIAEGGMGVDCDAPLSTDECVLRVRRKAGEAEHAGELVSFIQFELQFRRRPSAGRRRPGKRVAQWQTAPHSGTPSGTLPHSRPDSPGLAPLRSPQTKCPCLFPRRLLMP